MSTYYTLIVREDGRWHVQFGDYDRAVVKDERDDCRAHHRAKDLRILATADEPQAIANAIAAQA